MTDAEARVSLLPKDATVGGALDDINATIVSARFKSWDYRGKQPASCALLVTYKPEGWDGDDEDLPGHFTQAYSCGGGKPGQSNLDKYTPSADGNYVIPASGVVAGFNKSSNVMQFLISIIGAGVPESLIMPDGKAMIGNLEGAVVHLANIKQERRPGLKDDADAKERFTVLVDKLISLPGENAAGDAKPAAAKTTPAKAAGTAPAPKAKSVPKVSTAKATDPDIIEAAQGVVLQILGAAPGNKVTKAALAGLVFKAAADVEPDQARRNLMIQAAFVPDFLKADGAPWAFDGTTISLA